MLAIVILLGMFGMWETSHARSERWICILARGLWKRNFGPSWRRAFLGLQGLTPFVTPAEFFRPFLNESALFNHAWNPCREV